MCLSTTKAGDAYLDKLNDPQVETPTDVVVELMLLMQDQYIVVPNGGMTEWVAAIQKVQNEESWEYVYSALDIQAALLFGIANDWIGLVKVIWD